MSDRILLYMILAAVLSLMLMDDSTAPDKDPKPSICTSPTNGEKIDCDLLRK